MRNITKNANKTNMHNKIPKQKHFGNAFSSINETTTIANHCHVFCILYVLHMKSSMAISIGPQGMDFFTLCIWLAEDEECKDYVFPMT